MADAFVREGFSVIPWNDGEDTDESSGTKASILIINTCTVTSKSEQKARRLIRKALKDNSVSAIIVTGCYAQVEQEALEAISSEYENRSFQKRLFIIPGERKARILDLPRYLHASFGDISPESSDLASLIGSWARMDSEGIPSADDTSFCFIPGDFSFHSRAFLKIQDGCNNHCAYCRVHIARGKSRSLGASRALSELKTLENKGYEEAVLTGVNISQYCGSGASSAFMNLAELLEYLLAGTQRIRLRLSSIEPELFSPEFIRAVSHDRIRPHFHISLQSGSRTVLARMKRLYTPIEAEESIRLLRSSKIDPFIGCDIITGFPGESSEEFEETYNFCQRAAFSGIHAFPFSRRPGTEAWNMKNPVPEREAGQRAGKLTELARSNRRDYICRWIGKEVEGIAIENRGKLRGFVPVISANYLRLRASWGAEIPPEPGSLLRCRILGAISALQNRDLEQNSVPEQTPVSSDSRFDAEAEIIL